MAGRAAEGWPARGLHTVSSVLLVSLSLLLACAPGVPSETPQPEASGVAIASPPSGTLQEATPAVTLPGPRQFRSVTTGPACHRRVPPKLEAPPAALTAGALREVSLDQARRLVDFPVVEPSYVPEGLRLARVVLGGDPSEPVALTLFYEQNGRGFTLGQAKAVTAICAQVIRHVSIGGAPGVVATDQLELTTGEKFARTLVLWDRGELGMAVIGNLPEEELIRIAESVR